MIAALTSDLERARMDSPGTSDAELVVRLARQTLRELALQPPIDHEIVASMRDVIRVERKPIPWAGCLAPADDGLVITLRSGDCFKKQRFTAFHEINHTFLPGFGVSTQYRCDPATPTQTTAARDPGLETLCDLGAVELLLPRSMIAADMAGTAVTLDLIEQLSERYDASLEATARRVISLSPARRLLLALEPGCKPREPHATPALRVRWAHAKGNWPFIPKFKSVPDDSVFGQALQTGGAEEIASLSMLTNQLAEPLYVSARLYPYTGSQGELHMRVLALITPVRTTKARHDR